MRTRMHASLKIGGLTAGLQHFQYYWKRVPDICCYTVMASQQGWSESARLSHVAHSGAAGVLHTLVTSITSTHVWLKSVRSLTEDHWLEWSISDIHVWGHVFNVHLFPDKRDSVIIDRLRYAKSSMIRTEKFRNPLILYCLNHYD